MCNKYLEILFKRLSKILNFPIIISLIIIIFLITFALNQSRTANLEFKLSKSDKEYLISTSRKTIEQYLTKGIKYEVERIPNQFLINKTVIISLYLDGKISGVGKSQRGNLLESAIEATINALGDKKYNTIKTNEIEKVVIIINIIINRQELENKDVVFLTENFNTGLEGVYLQGSGLDFFLSPQSAVENDINIIQMLQSLCLRANLKTDCWGSKDIQIYKFDSINFMGKGTDIVDIYRAAPLVMQKSINKDEIYKSIVEAADWQLRMQKSDGSYEYLFNPATGIYANNNNLIRQAHSAWAMAKSYKLINNPHYLNSADKNIAFILYHAKKDGNIMYLSLDNISNIGQVAVTILAILEMPNHEKYKEEIGFFGDSLLSMQREDGSFRTYYNQNNYQDDFDYYPGEALLALVKLHRKTGNAKYLEAVEKAYPFYRTYFENVKHTGFVMWQISAFSETYRITHKREYLDFVYAMTDWIIGKQYGDNFVSKDFSGGFQPTINLDNKHAITGMDNVPTMSAGVYAEGITEAYQLAKMNNDKIRINDYGKSLRNTLRFILQLQFNDINTYYMTKPETAIGAIRESLISNNLRVDYTGHSVMALLKIYNVYDELPK